MLTEIPPVSLVEIVWEDAAAEAEWKTEEEDTEEDLCTTVGFLVKETKTAYYVSHTISTDNEGTLHWNSRIRIPRGMVRTYKVLLKGA